MPSNPTTYEAYLNYFDVLLVYRNQTLGNLTLEDTILVHGKNQIGARLRYAPESFPLGPENLESGSDLISRYLSEEHVAITLRAHSKSLPDFPNLSDALAYLPLEFEIPIPQLPILDDDGGNGDGDGDDDAKPSRGTGSQFLVSASFHFLSSTASFILRNPLNATVTVTDLHAVAVYHDNVIGTLDYGYPIILPGTERESETTRIPVSWCLPASDILRRALGGTLKVNATANATASIGTMTGMPLHIQLHEVGAGVGL